MGKRVIINGANFQVNGISESYTEYETTTEQGMVTPSTLAASFGYLGPTSSSGFYNNYVHSNETITLNPGQAIAIVDRPVNTTRAAILAYKSVDDTIYPDLVCSSEYVQFGTLVDGFGTNEFNDARVSEMLPRVVSNNTTSETWYIVLELNNQNSYISTTMFPTIKYRIYDAE